MSDLPNVVLVHGAWADGSSWSAVVQQLQADGYSVTAPQFPETASSPSIPQPVQGKRRDLRLRRRVGWPTT